MEKESCAFFLRTAVQLVFSLLAALIILLSLWVFFAVLLVTKDYRHSLIPFLSLVAISLAGFSGGLVAAFLHRSKGWLMGLSSGLLLFFCLLLSSLLVQGESMGSEGWLKLTLASVFGMFGGVLGVLLAARRKF